MEEILEEYGIGIVLFLVGGSAIGILGSIIGYL